MEEAESTALASPPSKLTMGIAIGFLCGSLVAFLVATQISGSSNGSRSTLTSGTAGGAGSATPAIGEASGAGATPPVADAAGSNTAPAGGSSGDRRSGTTAAGTGANGNGALAPAGAGAVQSGPAAPSHTLTVGVAVPDLSYLKAINAAWDSGPIASYIEAAAQYWRAQKMLPVGGVDLKFVSRKFNSLNASDAEATCQTLMADDHANVVLAPGAFGTGSDCVTQKYHAVEITTDLITDTQLAQDAPYLFNTDRTTTTILRNWILWADSNGLLKGKKIGIYSLTGGIRPAQYDADYQTVASTLSKRGYSIAASVKTASPLGGPDDDIAETKFQQAGVDLALLMVTDINQANFMQRAEQFGYRPAFIDSDYIWNTDDSVANIRSAAEADGELAVTGYHNGEVGSGQVSAESAACFQAVKQYAGLTVDLKSNQYRYALSSCDLVKTLVFGMRAAADAGRSVTATPSLIAGLESVHDLPMARTARVTFSPQSHEGSHLIRTIRYSGGCGCYKLVGSGAFVPEFTS